MSGSSPRPGARRVRELVTCGRPSRVDARRVWMLVACGCSSRVGAHSCSPHAGARHVWGEHRTQPADASVRRSARPPRRSSTTRRPRRADSALIRSRARRPGIRQAMPPGESEEGAPPLPSGKDSGIRGASGVRDPRRRPPAGTRKSCRDHTPERGQEPDAADAPDMRERRAFRSDARRSDGPGSGQRAAGSGQRAAGSGQRAAGSGQRAAGSGQRAERELLRIGRADRRRTRSARRRFT